MDVFCRKRCSYKFCKFHRKTPVLESFLKETPTHVFSCEICQIFKNTYFEKRLQTAASKNMQQAHKILCPITTIVSLILEALF